MRSSFGQLAQKLRAKRGLSQTEFASLIGEPLARVSNLEHQRTSINDDVVGKYISVLNCSGEECHELRQAASFSNTRMLAINKNLPHDRLHALLAEFGTSLSSRAVEKIRQVLVEELGPKVAALELSSTKSKSFRKLPDGKRAHVRPYLSPKRFVEICMKAAELRAQFSDPSLRLDVEGFIQKVSLSDTRLDLDWLDRLPDYAEGAFACIVGYRGGNVILVETGRYNHVSRNNPFVRHVLCHELAHHVLHSEILETDEER
jgi:transcriptional regulator with XRE-family HTH domain